jgi:hypothetical protein
LQQRLGKNPEDYPDAKSQPHVQVALRMKLRGGDARHGDVIPYVFCLAEGEQTAKTAQADRAKHPDEFRKVDSGLKLGTTVLARVLFLDDRSSFQISSIISDIKFFHQSKDCANQSRALTVLGWRSVSVSDSLP